MSINWQEQLYRHRQTDRIEWWLDIRMDIQICQRHWKTDKGTDRWETHRRQIKWHI